jgi:hypothetical protein
MNYLLIFLFPIVISLIVSLLVSVRGAKKGQTTKKILLISTGFNLLLSTYGALSWFYIFAIDGIDQAMGVIYYAGSFVIIAIITIILTFILKRILVKQ